MTWTSKEAQKEKKMVTINLEKNNAQELEHEKDKEQHTKELDHGTEDPYVDPKDVDSPFKKVKCGRRT